VRKKYSSLKLTGEFSPKKKKKVILLINRTLLEGQYTNFSIKQKVISSGTFRKDGIWRSTTGYANMLLSAFKHLPTYTVGVYKCFTKECI